MDPGTQRPSEANGGQAGEVTYHRRREQVRRAQRLHRDRRAAYLSSLEREVEELRTETAALRAGESFAGFMLSGFSVNADMSRAPAADESSKVKALEREVTQLRAEKAERLTDTETIVRLKQLLESHGIDLPPEFRYRHSKQYDAVAELRGGSTSNQHLQVTLPNPHTSSNFEATDHAAGSAPHGDNSHQATPQRYAQGIANGTKGRRSSSLVCQDGINGTQAGVDFVLFLERLCLHHHKLSSPELLLYGQLGTGHAMMLSSPVMARVPSATTHPSDIPLQQGCQWSVPAAELEKLLSLSQSLQLDREITPIGIWQRLRSHAKFHELTHGDLESLKTEIASLVVCYGFGAVVPEAVVDGSLTKVFNN